MLFYIIFFVNQSRWFQHTFIDLFMLTIVSRVRSIWKITRLSEIAKVIAEWTLTVHREIFPVPLGQSESDKMIQ